MCIRLIWWSDSRTLVKPRTCSDIAEKACSVSTRCQLDSISLPTQKIEASEVLSRGNEVERIKGSFPCYQQRDPRKFLMQKRQIICQQHHPQPLPEPISIDRSSVSRSLLRVHRHQSIALRDLQSELRNGHSVQIRKYRNRTLKPLGTSIM